MIWNQTYSFFINPQLVKVEYFLPSWEFCCVSMAEDWENSDEEADNLWLGYPDKKDYSTRSLPIQNINNVNYLIYKMIHFIISNVNRSIACHK